MYAASKEEYVAYIERYMGTPTEGGKSMPSTRHNTGLVADISQVGVRNTAITAAKAFTYHQQTNAVGFFLPTLLKRLLPCISRAQQRCAPAVI